MFFIVSNVKVRKTVAMSAISIIKVGVSGIWLDSENTIETLFVLKWFVHQT